MTDTQIRWTKRIATVAVLAMVVWGFAGCQTYEVQAGDITLKSNRVLLFDSKTGLSVAVTDANDNTVTISLDKSEQNPEDITVKANPLLQQYEVGTGGGR